MNFIKKWVMAMLFAALLCTVASASVYVFDGAQKVSFNTVNEAAEYLGEGGGKICVAKEISLTDGEELISKGKVSVTADGGCLNFAGNAYICGDFTFENITLNFAKSAAMIFCEGNDVTFGSGLVTSYSGTAPIIYGGTFGGKSGMSCEKMCFSDYTLTVESGTWYYLRGGNFRNAEGQPVGTLSGVTVNITGGTFTSKKTGASDNAVISPLGFDALLGDATLNILGGTFSGASIVGVARPGYNSTTTNNQYVKGNVYINVTGGNFDGGDVRAVQDSVASVIDGDFYVKISGGTFKNFGGVDGDRVNGLAIADLKSGISKKNFDRLITVSSGQSATVTGDALVRVNGEINSKALNISGDGKVVIEGASDNAKITIDKVLYVGTNTEIRNIALDGYGTGIISCSDGKILIDKGITGNGIALKNFTDATVRSGLFAYIKGAREKSVKLHIDGATVSGDIVAVANECNENGYVLVTSGTVKGNIYAFEYSGNDGAVHVLCDNFKGKVGTAKYATEDCVASFGAVVPSGAKIDYFGTASLCLPTEAIFVRSGGEGDGSSVNSPMGDITDAVNAAEGKNVVVCGPLYLKETTVLPKADEKTVITSKYMGIDYRDFYGARIELSSGLRISSETVFENIDFLAFEKYTFLSAEGNKLTVGEGVECRIFEGKRVEKYPSIVGASYAKTTNIAKVDLTVASGTWGTLTGGSYHTSDSDTKNYTVNGDVNVSIYGGTFEDGVYIAGRANIDGDANLNVFGGVFSCPLYVAHDDDTYVNGDVVIDIQGGTFFGDISRSGVGKTFTLNMADGDFDRVNTIDVGGGVLNVGEGIDFDAKIVGIGKYTNPIAGYADPSVVYKDGWYYYSFAKDYLGKPGLWMAKAANVYDLGNVRPKLIWAQAQSNHETEVSSLWAPQLYFLDGNWYLYATCDVGLESDVANGRRMPTVWKAKTEDPYGEYEFIGVMKNVDMDVYSYLSPRFIEHSGKLYMVNGGFFRKADTEDKHLQGTMVSELSDPVTMKGAAALISYADTDYEKGIMEGPFPLHSPNGTFYIIFAAGHTRTDEYCTGVMRFVGGENDSVQDAENWYKYPEPIHKVSYENGVYSPGAMVVTTTPDGEGYIAAYHAKEYHYSAYTMRRLYVQKLRFENDFPVIDEPASTDTVLELELNTLPLEKRLVNGKVSGIAEKKAGTAPKSDDIYIEYTFNGDMNNDGDTNMLDILKLMKLVVSGKASLGEIARADSNFDGVLDLKDVLSMLLNLL